MNRIGVFLALGVVLATGCAQRDLSLLSESELPGDVYGPAQPAPEPEPIPPNGTVYFVSGRHLEPAAVKLQPVLDSLAEALLVVLFQGPQAKGLSSEIPEGSRLNGVRVDGGLATIDVSGDFEQAAPPRSQALRIAQVVYTLTEFDEVDRVALFVNGERCCMYDMQSRPITRPLTRQMFRGWQGDPLPPPS